MTTRPGTGKIAWTDAAKRTVERLKDAEKATKAKPFLSAKNRRDIITQALTVHSGDLYTYLHRVGDDTTKAEIEDALRELLDDATFRAVVAVFKIATTE
jgi:hypothetical protein